MTEAVSKTEIEQLRKDAAMFSKNIRRIKSGHDLYIVAQAYVKWLDHMDRLLTGVFAINADQKREKPHESYEEKQVREKWWSLHIEGKDIFMVVYPRGTDLMKSAGGEQYQQFVYNGKEDRWQEYYTKFDAARNSSYTKFGKLSRDLFNAVDEWLARKEGNSFESYLKREDFKFMDLRCRILTTDETEENDKVKLKAYLRALKEATTRLKHFGFGNILHTLTFEVDFAKSDWAGGTYDHNNTIRSTAWGYTDPRVIAHEVGHHVYEKIISQKQRDGWINLIEKNQVRFSQQDFAAIRRAYDKVIAIGLQHVPDWNNTIDGIWDNLAKYIDDPQTQDLYKAFWKQYTALGHNGAYVPAPMKKDINGAFDQFKEAATPSFVYHLPTGYANKNPDEAFCEVFSYYIMGRGLAPFIFHQFIGIMGFKTH